jgi:uncharacterized membrane protein YhhN
MKKTSLYIFIAVSVAELISVTINLQLLNWVAKPLIMITLAFYYLVNTPSRNLLFLTAMGFCWLGDVFLMFQQDQQLFFMAGLSSFLIGHVLYIVCYRQMRNAESSGLQSTQKVRFSLPIILAGTGLVVILYPSLGDMVLPVMIYALVITVMSLQALFRYGFTNRASFKFIFIGAVLFMISDSLLAVNKFLTPFPYASLSIMFTYIAAQYLIAEGVIAHQANAQKQ